MDKIAVLVLAAGLGKRTKSSVPKALLQTSDQPLVLHVLETVSGLQPDRVVVVTGHKRELVEKEIRERVAQAPLPFKDLSFAHQPEPLGTGHAVKCALPVLQGFTGTVLILYGDVPLIRLGTLQALLETHHKERATVTILALVTGNTNTYGRIVRGSDGKVLEIIEARDCKPQHALVREFNAGFYAVDSAFLPAAVESLQNNNVQKEFYLTDIVGKAVQEGQNVAVSSLGDDSEVQGVNDLSDLYLVNQALRQRRARELLLSGVHVLDAQTLFLDRSVRIAAGATLGPLVQLYGKTIVEEDAVIEGCALLRDVIVRKGAHIKLGVRAEKSEVGPSAQVGPFAHLREGSVLGPEARVGNFVETKKASLEAGVKASHLTYLGDCHIGENTNIGAGTITCNYDGFHKSRTDIGRDVFIGSDTCLVAPVKVGDGAVVGAGSVITKDVDKDALALTRAPQTSKPDWARRRREKHGSRHHD